MQGWLLSRLGQGGLTVSYIILIFPAEMAVCDCWHPEALEEETIGKKPGQYGRHMETGWEYGDGSEVNFRGRARSTFNQSTLGVLSLMSTLCNIGLDWTQQVGGNLG
jgi:hypothetical protein